MSSTTSNSSTPTIKGHRLATSTHSPSISQPAPDSSGRIPVTPAVLRSIFASSRTPHEERSISRIAFFRFAGFLLSCLGISLLGARGKGIRNTSAALLGVV